MIQSGLDGVPPEQRHLFRAVVGRLEEQFAGTFGRETIERFVSDSAGQLAASAKVPAFLPVLTERFARQRLTALARLEGPPSDIPAVLFLCVHNSGRSQMAAGFTRHLGGDRVVVYSGGSDPGSVVNPTVIEAMREVGIDITDEFPKPWTEEIVRSVDVVITMGCGDACPVYPGTRYEDWELDDPAAQPLDATRRIRDDIRARVEELLTSILPVD